MFVWHCVECGTTGGKLGFTTHIPIDKERFCPYCDDGTMQQTVDVEEQYLADAVSCRK